MSDNTIQLKEVSKEEFFATIGPRNVHPEIVGNKYPYTSVYRSPDRVVHGKVTETLVNGKYPPKFTYFIVTNIKNCPYV